MFSLLRWCACIVYRNYERNEQKKLYAVYNKMLYCKYGKQAIMFSRLRWCAYIVLI